jgi:6-phospho-beta-glucosidase
VKIAVVGGSPTYTSERVDGLAQLPGLLPVDELLLVDPAAERLSVVGEFCRWPFQRHDHPGCLQWTSTVDDLADADVVVLQLRVGGQAARIIDETFPLECLCVGR